METFITVVHVIVALFMILVVLIQGGNQGGVGAAFGGGGGSSSIMGASGSQSLLGKITYGAAFVFMMTSITLTVLQSEGGSTGLKDELRKRIGDQPAAVQGLAPVAEPAAGTTEQPAGTMTSPDATAPATETESGTESSTPAPEGDK